MSSIGGWVRRAGAAQDVGEGHLLRRGQPARLGVGPGGDDVDAAIACGRRAAARAEAPAIDGQRRVELLRREVRRERVRQPELRGELRAEEAGPQDVDRHLGAGAGHGFDPLPGLDRREERLELEDVLREVLGVRRRRRSAASVC